MIKLAAVGALGLMVSGIFAQGLNPPGGQSKDSWEDINFEFNSSILSDGYPSLLRLSELLGQHRDYKVRVTGNTDYVGSGRYNDKLAMARANTVREFLVKYGAAADQVSTAGNGKRDPAVDNKTKEGRFINRRVFLTVTDGQGHTISDGGIGDAVKALQGIQDMLKKQEECCAQILKRLDKLDDILAAVKNLQGENDKLRGELTDLRNRQNALRDQVNGLPKPLSEQQTTTIAHNEAMGAVDEAQTRNKKFSLLGLNVGPTFGKGRTGDFTFSGRAQYFSPFGGDGHRAVQAQGEYMYYPDRQEGQFDLGLVNRWNNIQAGAFGSFKYLGFKQFQSGGSLAQASFLADYLFSRGRVGIFGSKGFKNTAVLNSVTLAPGAYLQTYARLMDQIGGSALVGAWGNAYFEGNLAYLKSHGSGRNRPGGMLRLVNPFNEHIAGTVEIGYNESFVNASDAGRVAFGVQFGNFIHPKDYRSGSSPVPMDVPRVRYEMLTRRVGSSPPVANAGPNQFGVAAGTITLDGSGSYDPLGLTLTYAWSQTGGPSVALSSTNQPAATFTAAAGQTYTFRLRVTNTDNLSSAATVTVSTGTPGQVRIVQFAATPNTIQPGQSTSLSWSVENATSVTIQPAPGSVDSRSGSTSVSPAQTTTYTLTATGAGGTVNSTVTVQVGNGTPQIIRFEASPLTIAPGQQSTLSWTTTGATAVSINGVGSVAPNGSVNVNPSQTTTYTLTAATADGKSVTAPVTVTVTSGTVPQIVTFVANPQTIDAGSSTKLCWQINGATSIQIAPSVGANLSANDCATVSPTQTTTYTLTATNATGTIQANVTVNVGQVRILSFTADPVFSTTSGGPVTLSWQTQNATSTVVTGADIPAQTLQPSGSLTVHPISNATYTLTAYGPGGQTVSVTIAVHVR
jgi:hypothetical protein